MPNNRRRLTPGEIGAAITLRAQGRTLQQIADHTGVSYTLVRNALMKAGGHVPREARAGLRLTEPQRLLVTSHWPQARRAAWRSWRACRHLRHLGLDAVESEAAWALVRCAMRWDGRLSFAAYLSATLGPRLPRLASRRGPGRLRERPFTDCPPGLLAAAEGVCARTAGTWAREAAGAARKAGEA